MCCGADWCLPRPLIKEPLAKPFYDGKRRLRREGAREALVIRDASIASRRGSRMLRANQQATVGTERSGVTHVVQCGPKGERSE